MQTPGYKTQRMLKSRTSRLRSGYFQVPTAFTRGFDIFGPPFRIISITSSGSPGSILNLNDSVSSTSSTTAANFLRFKEIQELGGKASLLLNTRQGTSSIVGTMNTVGRIREGPSGCRHGTHASDDGTSEENEALVLGSRVRPKASYSAKSGKHLTNPCRRHLHFQRPVTLPTTQFGAASGLATANLYLSPPPFNLLPPCFHLSPSQIMLLPPLSNVWLSFIC